MQSPDPSCHEVNNAIPVKQTAKEKIAAQEKPTALIDSTIPKGTSVKENNTIAKGKTNKINLKHANNDSLNKNLHVANPISINDESTKYFSNKNPSMTTSQASSSINLSKS